MSLSNLMIVMAEQQMSLKELAGKAGLSLNTVSAVANGKSCTTVTAGKIAKALGVSVAELVGK